MADRFDKDQLFNEYFQALKDTIGSFNDMFHVDGVWAQVSGVDDQSGNFSEKFEATARTHVRSSFAWRRLEGLRDYAQDGELYDEDDADLGTAVMEATQIVSLVTSELYGPSAAWREIVQRADGRCTLDGGHALKPEYISVLAGIDIRVLRNSIDSGELTTSQYEGNTYVDNSSARNWLHGRPGFTPTKLLGSTAYRLSRISTPSAFGAFLVSQRVRLGLRTEPKEFVSIHYAVGAKSFSDLESGIFTLPIDAAFPLADFYHVERKSFLACVMRTFIPEQLPRVQSVRSTAKSISS